MAEFKQQDKYEIYFTPEQALRLKQAAFQSSLDSTKYSGERREYKGSHLLRTGWKPKQGNISSIVRKAVDEYLDPDKIKIPDSIPLTQKSCWATFHTMLCLKKNFDKISNRERAADVMDILDDLMERGNCWNISSIARVAEQTGARQKKYRFHTRNVVETAARRKEEERIGISEQEVEPYYVLTSSHG